MRPSVVPQTAYIHPRIMGDMVRYFEWMGAAVYTATAAPAPCMANNFCSMPSTQELMTPFSTAVWILPRTWFRPQTSNSWSTSSPGPSRSLGLGVPCA